MVFQPRCSIMTNELPQNRQDQETTLLQQACTISFVLLHGSLNPGL